MYREITDQIKKLLFSQHHLIPLIVGLRQVGKTTLAKTICEGRDFLDFNFELSSDQQMFLDQNRHSLEDFASKNKNKIIFIDEVQKLPEATSVIKHLFDNYKLRFLLTGSSELKLKAHFGDSMTGRTMTYRLYPLTIRELLIQRGKMKNDGKVDFDKAMTMMQNILIYGSLPGVENQELDQVPTYLTNFSSQLLSKDVLEISSVRRPTVIFSLAKFLAMQIGQLVNVNELSNLLETPRASIYNYLDILEQLNLIIRAHPLSTNDRQAISEKFKVYFTDLGVRNSLINNFSSLNARLDNGQLLENAVYLGLKRKLEYEGKVFQMGFFRSPNGSEIDIVMKISGKEELYEVKNSNKYLDKKGNVTYITRNTAWQYL